MKVKWTMAPVDDKGADIPNPVLHEVQVELNYSQYMPLIPQLNI